MVLRVLVPHRVTRPGHAVLPVAASALHRVAGPGHRGEVLRVLDVCGDVPPVVVGGDGLTAHRDADVRQLDAVLVPDHAVDVVAGGEDVDVVHGGGRREGIRRFVGRHAVVAQGGRPPGRRAPPVVAVPDPGDRVGAQLPARRAQLRRGGRPEGLRLDVLAVHRVERQLDARVVVRGHIELGGGILRQRHRPAHGVAADGAGPDVGEGRAGGLEVLVRIVRRLGAQVHRVVEAALVAERAAHHLVGLEVPVGLRLVRVDDLAVHVGRGLHDDVEIGRNVVEDRVPVIGVAGAAPGMLGPVLVVRNRPRASVSRRCAGSPAGCPCRAISADAPTS